MKHWQDSYYHKHPTQITLPYGYAGRFVLYTCDGNSCEITKMGRPEEKK